MLRKFLKDESGATGIEYAMLLAMCGLIIAPFIEPIGQRTNNIFGFVQAALTP